MKFPLVRHLNHSRVPVFLCAILFISISSPAAAQELSVRQNLTLDECYQLALKRSETLAIRKEVIKEAEGRFLQSFGSILPRGRFAYSHKIQDGAGGSNFTLGEIPEAKFYFQQPLFSGFKEFAAMAASRAEKKQFQHDLLRAQQLLYVDVSDAFYFLLQYQEDIGALEATHKALLERLDELKKREGVGRSRPSEVASAQANLSRNEAEMETVTSQRDVGKQLLEFLTGVNIDSVKDAATPEEALQGVGSYLLRGDERPDVLSAKEAVKVAQKRVVVAKAAYWPQVSLEGDYYTKLVGNLDGVDWDMTMVVDAPVFEGGQTVGKVKEAQAQARAAELSFSAAKRKAQLDIQNSFSQIVAAQRRFQALEKAVAAAERNYQLQREDYQRNLVNNLEVLQSLQDMQDMRRDLIVARNDVKRLYRQFQAAIGELPQ